MAHITLPDGLPGIRGLLVSHPATAKPMGELAEVLLRGPSTLTMAERELVATHVSFRNDCHYCHPLTAPSPPSISAGGTPTTRSSTRSKRTPRRRPSPRR